MSAAAVSGVHEYRTNPGGSVECACGIWEDFEKFIEHTWTLPKAKELFISGSSRHPNSARFHELLKQAGDLHDKKQGDYGRGDDPFANVRASEDWNIPGWVGAMVRANDKVRRLQNFAQKGTLANESVADSLMDIAVYSLIALVLYEQESKK